MTKDVTLRLACVTARTMTFFKTLMSALQVDTGFPWLPLSLVGHLPIR